MYTFGQLRVGDMFNTKPTRWVKTTDSYAVCVMSAIHLVGQQFAFKLSEEVIVLWSSDRGINRVSQHASCSESEKEDRFYRNIEDKIDAENRERQAAEFKQSLIDERDALIVRRECVSRHMNDRSVRGTELYWLSEQYNVMYNYIAALNARIYLLEQPAA